jgi:hypothetical protein
LIFFFAVGYEALIIGPVRIASSLIGGIVSFLDNLTFIEVIVVSTTIFICIFTTSCVEIPSRPHIPRNVHTEVVRRITTATLDRRSPCATPRGETAAVDLAVREACASGLHFTRELMGGFIYLLLAV